jgi:hypothetical protein
MKREAFDSQEAFTWGYKSNLHDSPPLAALRTPYKISAWYIGAYFMRAGLPMPAKIKPMGARVLDLPYFGKTRVKVLSVDGVLYANAPDPVGSKVIAL